MSVPTEATLEAAVRLARQVVDEALGRSGRETGESSVELPEASLGVAVRVRQGGVLCGFAGRLQPGPTLGQSIREAAAAAVLADGRQPAPRGDLPVEVDLWLLGAAREVRGPDEIETAAEGVAVECGRSRAVALPGLVEDESSRGLLESACIGAGLGPAGWKRSAVRIRAFAVWQARPASD